jgi:hypothetical protein
MSQQNDDMKYRVNPELVRRYLAGELDDKAMHALERQAMDDPLLAEALEGFESALPDQSAHLADLENRLAKRVQSTKRSVVPMYVRWSAAAAVLILAGLATLWLWQPQQSKNLADVVPPKIDTLKQAPTPTDTFQNLSDSLDSKPLTFSPDQPKPAAVRAKKEGNGNADEYINADRHGEEAAPKTSVAPPAAEPMTTVPLANADKFHVTPPPAIAGDTSVLQSLAGRAPGLYITQSSRKARKQDADTLDAVVVTGYAKSNAYRESSTGAVTMLSRDYLTKPGHTPTITVKGKVTDEQGSPLPGVSIREAGTDKATVTSTDGRFAITVDSTGHTALNLSYIGFINKQLQIKGDSTLQAIALKENNAHLSEVVVTGYAMPDADERPPNVTPPEPAGGFKALHQYLKTNVKCATRGKIKLSFLVDQDGQLSDFKVTKKLSPDCDADVIRALKEGPAWNASSDKKTRRVRIAEEF